MCNFAIDILAIITIISIRKKDWSLLRRCLHYHIIIDINCSICLCIIYIIIYVQFRYRCPCCNYNYYHSIKKAGRFLAYIIILLIYIYHVCMRAIVCQLMYTDTGCLCTLQAIHGPVITMLLWPSALLSLDSLGDNVSVLVYITQLYQ